MSTVTVGVDNFATTIEQDGIVLLDFWASWCGPCRSFAPVYEAASEANPDIVFGSINTEEERVKTGIPLLMHIPILGQLFSSTRFQKNESELVVIVKNDSDTQPKRVCARELREAVWVGQ